VKHVLAGLFAAALAGVAAPADAGVFYQSIPDLTVAPNIPEGSCSTCAGSGNQWTGEMFSLSSNETVRSIQFTAATATFPTSVTLGFYDVVGGSMTVGGQVGTNFTLSTSSFETITPGTQPTNIVTAVLGGGGQTLTAGSYLLFITSSNLALPEYLGNGKGIFVTDGVLDLLPGQTYQLLGNSFDIGVALSNSVPETSTWAMMAVGFAGLAVAALRQRRRSAHAIA
jgi:MYXO-CTERM domain-containing protein